MIYVKELFIWQIVLVILLKMGCISPINGNDRIKAGVETTTTTEQIETTTSNTKNMTRRLTVESASCISDTKNTWNRSRIIKYSIRTNNPIDEKEAEYQATNIISLTNLQITNLESDSFRNLTQLKDLYLFYNSLTCLDDSNLFVDLIDLRYLSLGVNQLSSLDPFLFNSLTNLISLDLSFNQLTELNSFSFVSLSSLENLYLSGNRLISLDSSLFNILISLYRLDLRRNQLTAVNPPTVETP